MSGIDHWINYKAVITYDFWDELLVKYYGERIITEDDGWRVEMYFYNDHYYLMKMERINE